MVVVVDVDCCVDVVIVVVGLLSCVQITQRGFNQIKSSSTNLQKLAKLADPEARQAQILVRMLTRNHK